MHQQEAMEIESQEPSIAYSAKPQKSLSIWSIFMLIPLVLILVSVFLSRMDQTSNFYISGIVLQLENALGFSLSPIKSLYKVEMSLDSVELFNKASEKNYYAVSKLLDLKVDGNSYDVKGDTVLISAVRQEDESLVKLLLNKSVDVDLRSSEGLAALHHAIEQDNKALIEILLDSGADINLRDDFEHTPLMLSAAKVNSSVLLSLLEKKPKIDLQDEQGQTALFHATLVDNEKAVRILLASGANHKIASHSGSTIETIAAKGGEVEKLLRQRGISQDQDRRKVLKEDEPREVFEIQAQPDPEPVEEVREVKNKYESNPDRIKMTGVRAKSRPVGVWKRKKKLTLESVSVTLRNYGGVEAKSIKARVRVPGGSFVDLSGPDNLAPYSEALYSASPGTSINRNGKLRAFVTCDNCHR